MNKLRQAAQAALDALNQHGSPYLGHIEEYRHAVEGLRAALEAPEQEPVGYVFEKRDFIGSVIGAKGAWAPHEIPIYSDPVEAPDIKALQAEGKGPAPCARFCEAQAFKIEIRNLEHERDEMRNKYLQGVELANSFAQLTVDLTKERDALLAAGRLALEALNLAYMRSEKLIEKEYEQAITALKAAGVE